MSDMQCSICGSDGATLYYCSDKEADTSNFAWFHVLCLAKDQMIGHCEKLKMRKPVAKGYLAGLIDGEGHVHRRTGAVCIVNTDIGVLSAAKRAADCLGIPTSLTLGGQKPGYAPAFKLNLLGGKSTRQKLYRLPIASANKRDVLGKYV